MKSTQTCFEEPVKATSCDHLPIKDLLERDHLSACDQKYLDEARWAMADITETVKNYILPALEERSISALEEQFESIKINSPDFYDQVSDYCLLIYQDASLFERLNKSILLPFEELFESLSSAQYQISSIFDEISENLSEYAINAFGIHYSENFKEAIGLLEVKTKTKSVYERKYEIEKAIRILEREGWQLDHENKTLRQEKRRFDDLCEFYFEEDPDSKQSPAVQRMAALLELQSIRVTVNPDEERRIKKLSELDPDFILEHMERAQKYYLVFGKATPDRRSCQSENSKRESVLNSLQIVQGSIAHYSPQAEEIDGPYISKARFRPKHGDIAFGRNLFSKSNGRVYHLKTGDFMGNIKVAGHHLLDVLVKDNKKVGREDYRPKNKDAMYKWDTIKNAKLDILKLDGGAIRTDENDKYHYGYKA